MTTWTCNNFIGHWPVGTSLVVTAETVAMAIILIETKLDSVGLPQTIKPEQLVPLPTHHRNVRILQDGNY